jgi:hypothetical protein
MPILEEKSEYELKMEDLEFETSAAQVGQVAKT